MRENWDHFVMLQRRIDRNWHLQDVCDHQYHQISQFSHEIPLLSKTFNLLFKAIFCKKSFVEFPSHSATVNLLSRLISSSSFASKRPRSVRFSFNVGLITPSSVSRIRFLATDRKQQSIFLDSISGHGPAVQNRINMSVMFFHISVICKLSVIK